MPRAEARSLTGHYPPGLKRRPVKGIFDHAQAIFKNPDRLQTSVSRHTQKNCNDAENRIFCNGTRTTKWMMAFLKSFATATDVNTALCMTAVNCPLDGQCRPDRLSQAARASCTCRD